MKKNYSFNQFFVLFFLVFVIKNNFSAELSSAISRRVKNKTAILRAPSMQLSFINYSNLFTLYLGQKLFNTSKIQDMIKSRNLDSPEINKARKSLGNIFGYIHINNDFENYFAKNLKEKKYINLSTNLLWYFFSTYAFFLKSDRFKKIINSKKYLSLFDKKIKEFVPYFNLIYPFATFLENKYFERKERERERERKERGFLQNADKRGDIQDILPHFKIPHSVQPLFRLPFYLPVRFLPK